MRVASFFVISATGMIRSGVNYSSNWLFTVAVLWVRALISQWRCKPRIVAHWEYSHVKSSHPCQSLSMIVRYLSASSDDIFIFLHYKLFCDDGAI